MSVRELYPEATFTSENPEAIRHVFEMLPLICQRVVSEAALTPDKWWPYAVIESRCGLAPGQFKNSFGGYRSHDNLRPRPFHIGTSLRSGTFNLRVNQLQAEAILGERID